jgi:hypothetical protein
MAVTDLLGRSDRGDFKYRFHRRLAYITPVKAFTKSMLIIAVVVLSFTAGRVFRGWQQRVK